MSDYTTATLMDLKEGKTYTVFNTIKIEILEKIHKGQIVLLSIDRGSYPDMLTPTEMNLLIAQEKGEIIPESFQIELKTAEAKRAILIECAKSRGVKDANTS